MALFGRESLREWLDARAREVLARVDSFDEDQVKFSPEAVAANLLESARIGEISVDWEGISKDPVRTVAREAIEFGHRIRVNLQSLTIYVPTSGPSNLFGMQPSTFYQGGIHNVDLRGSSLVIEVEERAITPDDVTRAIAQVRKQVDAQCEQVNQDVQRWHSQLLRQLEANATRRKERLDANAALDAAIAIPMRATKADSRVNVPVQRRTASISTIRDKTAPSRAAEPFLDSQIYEAIVEQIRTVGNTAERLPGTAAKFDEEEWRDLLLFILNANFEGQAQAEAFNGAGKTDILLRHDDRNVFIGECKVWRGSQAFSDALDQLLGYTVWRDSKAALIVFIRNKNASQAIENAHAAIVEHTSFVSAKPAHDPDARRDYLIRSPEDAERTITLALLPIVVRAPEVEA